MKTGGSVRTTATAAAEKRIHATVILIFLFQIVLRMDSRENSGVNGLITHRLVSISDHGTHGVSYRTKGDANPKADPWRFQLDQPTQAKVAFAIPYLGFGIAALSVLPVRILILGVPALLIALALCARLWRQAGEEAHERNLAIIAAHEERMAAAAPPAQGGALPSRGHEGGWPSPRRSSWWSSQHGRPQHPGRALRRRSRTPVTHSPLPAHSQGSGSRAAAIREPARPVARSRAWAFSPMS